MILVTGATGRIGSRVVAGLVARGAGVRVLVRPTSAAPAAWGSVETVVGDLGDPACVARAVAGTTSIFMLSPINPDLDHFEHLVITAAARAGTGHIVKLSTTAPAVDSPISWWRAHWRAEELLRASRLPWTILRPNGIATFLLDFGPEVRARGTVSTAAQAGRMALIVPDDVAAVAVRILDDGPRGAGTTLDLTGPEPLSYDDVAATLTELLRRTVVHRHLDAEAAANALADRGLTGWAAEGVLANWLMTRDGIGEFGRVTDDVRLVLGRPARTVQEYLAANADVFRSAA